MRSRTVVGIAAVVVVIVGIGVGHDETGARFRSSISPLATFGARMSPGAVRVRLEIAILQ